MSSFSTRSLWVRIGKSQYLEMEDQKLIELVSRQSDVNAFCVLYDRHKHMVTNYLFGLYQNPKRASKESIQLFIEIFQNKERWQNQGLMEFALSLKTQKILKPSKKGEGQSVVLDELGFLQQWSKREVSELLEELDHMDKDKLNLIFIWLYTKLSDELQAKIQGLSVSQWKRELGAAMAQWFEVGDMVASKFSSQVGPADQKLKNQAKAVLWQDFDQEMDFVFWSRFDKECQPKSVAAKWWAPVLLFLFVSLIALSAFFRQELPGQKNEQRGAFSLKPMIKEAPSATPASGD